MKIRSAKNGIIAFLLLTNLVSGTYILAKETPLKDLFKEKSLKRSTDVKSTGADPLEIYRKKMLRPEARAYSDALQVCWEVYLATDPHQKDGKVVAQWHIAEDGNVSQISLKRNDIENDEFESCLMDHLSKMTFTPPPMGTMVAYTFNFKRRE